MTTCVKRSVTLLLAAGAFFSAYAQTSNAYPNGWHLKDNATDGYYGISLDKAYNFVKGKKSTPVVVAVIDSGIDTTHEDLKSVLWTNTKELPGNGIDDDNNGYVDDVHGWNFLGGRDGRNVEKDSYEGARVYHKYKSRFETADTATLSEADRVLYQTWVKAKAAVLNGVDVNELLFIRRMYPDFKSGDSVIAKDLNKTEYNGNDLKSYNPTDRNATMAKNILMAISKANNDNYDITNKDLLEELEGKLRKAEAVDQAPQDYRAEIVKDNYEDINDRFYGNNDIMAGSPMHGTHVSGIIAAARGNGKGVDGIANNVKIMALRAVPDGDEHDKDVALSIRYAVDNGAKIINMSFGKSFSPEKQWVDEAAKYAASKGVLLVQAAGNDGENIDSADNFPSKVLLDQQVATNWITVGANGPKGDELVAYFSNYGKKNVDVFAPGVQIYSTVPVGNQYRKTSGTSMASPVVTGLAAFVLSYYPTLTPQQVREVIMQSTAKVNTKVKNPETGQTVPFSDLSASGGVVNAYEAVKLADALSGRKLAPAKSAAVVKKVKRA